MISGETVYYIYRITNNITNSVYIGITNDTTKRFREHKNNSSNKYLKASIDTYGLDNFSFEILEETSKELVSEKEIEYIKEAKQHGNVYNISKGGLIGNGMPGVDHWNAKLTPQDIINIRELYSSNKITQKNLSNIFNVSSKQISKILRGERWSSIEGPLSKNLIKNKVANRRKLTDYEVLEVRQEALDEYTLTGFLDIPAISEMYNISRNSMRKILLGEVYKNLGGPILRKDYYMEFGKNGIKS